MAEVILFNCPACGTMLRLPLTMAAERGPCPTCGREIVAPDPYRGIGAQEAPFAEFSKALEPFRPFADSPPLLAIEPQIAAPPPFPAPPRDEPARVIHEETPPAPSPVPVAREIKICAGPQKAVLVLSCLLSGAVALAIGYVLGVRSTGYFMENPVVSPPKVVTQPIIDKPADLPPPVVKQQEPPKPAPKPEPIPPVMKPVIEAPKPEKKEEPPVKVSAAAEASLRAFLEAPDWATRSAHVLFSESVRSAMETYSHEVPDGPTPYKSISVQQSQTDEKTGNTLFIFSVRTETVPTGIPVAVLETPQGWLVDWQSFVEFRDDQFKKFADGPAGQTKHFHLIVSTPPPARAAVTENELFGSFLLDPPLPERQQLAFVRKNTEAYATCQSLTASGSIFGPVLEVTKRNTPDGQGYLEILTVLATDWLPKEK
ncbi:MAG: hypothetical protein ABI162_18080 [Luteolibacter sp.]